MTEILIILTILVLVVAGFVAVTFIIGLIRILIG